MDWDMGVDEDTTVQRMSLMMRTKSVSKSTFAKTGFHIISSGFKAQGP